MYPKLIQNVIDNLSKLPGVGKRSAERIVFWLLNQSQDTTQALSNSITLLKENLQFCKQCNNFSEADVCSVCSNPSRDQSTVCIVENPKDVIAIEKTGTYKGLYHVTLGTISPSDGKGPETLKVQQLFDRVQKGLVREVILATDPDSEGEMTALYLTKQLKSFPVKVSRIGLGIPVGSSVEYADLSTLSMSLNARREL